MYFPAYRQTKLKLSHRANCAVESKKIAVNK